uniref:Mitochondrial inner membrane protein COX18 n=1 Tax=Parastrongyloides trichosuri TaxID=131310 RepID=A0A0N4ZGC1_PARTI
MVEMFSSKCIRPSLLRGSLGIRNSINLSKNGFEIKRYNSNLPPVLNDIFQYAGSCNITSSLQYCIEGIHDVSGLGWGATFIASAFVLRAVSSPAHIYAEKLFADRIHLTNYIHKRVIEDVGKQLNIRVKPNEAGTQLQLMTDDKKVAIATAKHIEQTTHKLLTEKKLFASRIQNLKLSTVPIWIFSSFAVRNIISGDFNPAMPGHLWLTDLMLPDPYYIMPVAVGLLGFLNMYSQKLIFPQQSNFQSKSYDVLLAVMTIAAVRIMMDLPACVSLYWLSVSVSGMVENSIIRYPKFKELIGIKRLPTDSKYPLMNLFNRKH